MSHYNMFLMVWKQLINEETYHPNIAVQDKYREIYYMALDLTISSLEECFDQPAFKVYDSMLIWLLLWFDDEEIFDAGLSVLKNTVSDADIEAAMKHSKLNSVMATISKSNLFTCFKLSVTFYQL